MKILNAQIESTFLGYNGREKRTFYLYLRLEGGYRARVGGKALPIVMITDILRIAGVPRWEDLKGRDIAIAIKDNKVVSIGNFRDDRWLHLEEEK